MAAAQDTTSESSVAFNLRQLLQLEDERIAREQLAVRAAHEARERARSERERAEREAAAQRARESAEEALRTADEREAALLRVRLEAAARERARAEQHTRESEQFERASRRGRTRLVWLAVLGLAATAALSAGGLRVAELRISAAQAAANTAARTAAERALEIAQLRSRLAQKDQPPAVVPAVQPQPTAAAPLRRPPTQQHVVKRKQPHKPAGAELPAEGEGNDDPIEDL